MVIGKWQPRPNEYCTGERWVRTGTYTMNCTKRADAIRHGVELVAALEKQMEAGNSGNSEQWRTLQSQIEAFGDPERWWRATGGEQREKAAERQLASAATRRQLN